MTSCLFGKLAHIPSNKSLPLLSLVDSATTTGGSAVMHDTAPRAANGLQKTPEAAVSKENGRQRFTPSSLGSQCHDISGDGIRPLPSKVDAVNKFPKPTTVKQLQEFLGMINYYHRFIPNAAEILSPLYRLSATKQKDLEGWTPDHEHSFLAAKEALAQAATLATPTSTDKLYLVTDASNIAIGAVLERCNDGHRQPLGFFTSQFIDGVNLRDKGLKV